MATPLERFRSSLGEPVPPQGLPRALRALWQAGTGDWEAAHRTVQEDESDPLNAWVHAHLHRQEGDLGNAGYWYRRAGKPVPTGSITAEWEAIVAALLED